MSEKIRIPETVMALISALELATRKVYRWAFSRILHCEFQPVALEAIPNPGWTVRKYLGVAEVVLMGRDVMGRDVTEEVRVEMIYSCFESSEFFIDIKVTYDERFDGHHGKQSFIYWENRGIHETVGVTSST